MGTLTTMPPPDPVERGRRKAHHGAPPPAGASPRRRYNRVVAFGLSGEEWDTLTEMAVSEARDPFAQARWVVLQAIRVFAEERAS